MSNILTKYGGNLPTIFNPSDFETLELIVDSLTANVVSSSYVSSNSVVSSAVSIQNSDGSTSPTVSQSSLTSAINALTGGTLNNSLQTLLQIDAAINNDPNFYNDITSSISSVQTNVNNNSSSITALQNRATTDETNITNLQNTINGLSTNLTTNNLIVNTGLTSASIIDNGSLTCNNGLTVFGTVSFPSGSIAQSAINNLSSTLSILAPLASPSLTGNPTCPTQSASDNSTKIASTAYVQSNLLAYETVANFNSTISTLAAKSNPTFTGTVTLPSVIDNGNATFNGTTTFTQNLIANSTTITPTQLSFISGLTANAQNAITNNTNNIATNTTNIATNTNSISSINTTLAGKQNTLTFDTTPTSSSTNPVTSGGIYTALASKQNTLSFDTTPTNSSTNPVTSGGIYTALASKQNTLSFDTTPTLSSTNPVTSGGVYTALQNYETTSALTTTLSNYATTSSVSSTYAPLNNANLTGQTTVNEVSELINAVSGITTSLSLSYSSCKGINYIQTPTSNFSLALSNIPTSSTTASYTVSLYIPAKYYCNSITVNGTSYTMVAGGGLANITVNSSASAVLQQISVLFLNSSTPTIMTNVLSIF